MLIRNLLILSLLNRKLASILKVSESSPKVTRM